MAAKARTALLALAVAAAIQAGEADSLFNLANGYMARKEYDLAVETYDRVLKADPDFAQAPLALYRKAWCLNAQERFADAETVLVGLLETHAKAEVEPKALHLLGLARLKQSKDAEGAAALLELVEKHPKYASAPGALHRAAEALYKIGRHKDAAAAYAKLAEGYPDYKLAPHIYYSLGWAHLQLKAYDAAAEAFATVVAKFPKSEVAAESQYKVGEARLEAKAYDQAVAAFQKTIDAFPGDYADDALLGIGRAQFEQGQYAKAAKTFLSLPERFPKSPEKPRAVYDGGNSLFYAEDYTAALAAFDRVIATAPRPVEPA